MSQKVIFCWPAMPNDSADQRGGEAAGSWGLAARPRYSARRPSTGEMELSMQDRYAGDVGDYVTLALRRHLSGADRKLGIAWYLHPDTTGGGHIRYLSDPAR